MNTEGIIAQISRIREAANALITLELKKRSIKGVVPAHGPVLMYLFEQKKPIPIKSIVDNIGRVKSTVTVMIQTLQSYGYIQKLPSEIDNRVIMIELTQKGRNLRKDFNEISKILQDKVYGKMKIKDRQYIVNQLDIIEKNMS